MWDTYRDLASIYFPNCKIAVDSFHIIRHLNDAINTIRIKTLEKYDKQTNKFVQNDIFIIRLRSFIFFFTMSFEKIFNNQTYIQKMKTKWTKHEIRNYLFSIDEEFEELIEAFINSKHEEFRIFGNF